MRSQLARALVAERGSIAADPGIPAFLFEFATGLHDEEIREAVDAHLGRVSRISQKWRPITDDFGQQLLNARFIKFLLSKRPSNIEFRTVCGVTVDMVRIASLFGVQPHLAVPCRDVLPAPGSRAAIWLTTAVEGATIMPDSASTVDRDSLMEVISVTARKMAAFIQPDADVPQDPLPTGLGYEAYAFGQRDHALLYRMQAPLVHHFHGCRRVLDLGCGTGLFLDALNRKGIESIGVDRNMLSVRYARGLGHRVIASDVLAYLDRTAENFEGVYCSHFVEHLPIEALDRLIFLVSKILKPNGVAVFVFPDPESIRSQLLGFWRDPEHVRFYHPDLIAMIGEMYGLACEFHSHDQPGRRVVPFEMDPPIERDLGTFESVDEPPADFSQLPFPSVPTTLLDRVLGLLGFASRTRLDRVTARLNEVLPAMMRRQQQVESRERMLRRVVDTLWSVNQTWAWDDNAVLRLRKGDS